jgi:hypothetical protein
MGTLRAPDGTGIKGGRVNYHAMRMLTGIALVKEFPLDSDFIVTLIVHHARLAARAALNGMGRKVER